MKQWWKMMILTVLICTCLSVSAEAANGSFAPGDTVYFGHYEQDGDQNNGQEPILWIVLEAKDEKVLLLSRDILDCQPYHSDYSAVTWAESSLRIWLNDIWIAAAFTRDELSAVRMTLVENDTSQGLWRTESGTDTEDQIFLLSWKDLQQYLPSSADWACTMTVYAHEQQADLTGRVPGGIPADSWWLRSPGSISFYAASITGRQFGGNIVTNQAIGIRPAVWVDADVLSGGSELH